MHSSRVLMLIFLSAIVFMTFAIVAPGRAHAQQTQRLVESVDITGNRRLRKDDVLYYVQTRAGDPFNEQQVQRDLQAILALGFFDKTATRVLTEEGARGHDGEPAAVDRVTPMDVTQPAEDHGQADARELVGDDRPGDPENVGTERAGDRRERDDEAAPGEAGDELPEHGVGEEEPVGTCSHDRGAPWCAQ